MIFEFNYEKETILCLYKFSEIFDIQPIHFCSNENQDIFVVASESDGVWCDTREKVDVDLDEHFNIGGIQQIVYDLEDKVFYFLANQKNG